MTKYFKLNDSGWYIPVTIYKDGKVNVGATGEIDIDDFIRLASSVVCEFNAENDTFWGFRGCNDLVDYPK